MRPARLILASLLLAALAAGGESAPAGFGPVEVGPYLLAPEAASMTVCWKTKAAEAGKVEYGATAEYGQTAEAKEAKARQKVTLAGLKPGAEYHYRVVTAAGTTGDFVFRALPGPEEPLSFIVDGDQDGEVGAKRAARSQAAYLAIKPNFVVTCGDLANDEEAAYDALLRLNRRLWASTPWYPAFGNHDILGDRQGRGAMRQVFAIPDPPETGRKQPCMIYYSFDAGGCHFAVRDKTVTYADEASPAERAAQHKWLASDLAAGRARNRFVFVFQHDSEGEDFNVKYTPADLVRNADIFFWGGLHNYHRTKRGGLHLVQTSGGGTARLRDPPAGVTVGKSCLHYVRVDVEKDKLTLRAFDMGQPDAPAKSPQGELLDTLELTARSAGSRQPAE